ncbi:MAG: RNA polymerase sigma factor [Kangiellaceae bacterium]|nr:RNA polymerase sigma factor [Kangiellaceae bacterium]
MTVSTKQTDFSTLEELEDAVRELRPQIHRFCARMVGSVIDGEDILQSSLVKAFEALKRGDKVEKLKPWLFRIAHNVAMDYLRSRKFKVIMEQEHIEPEQDRHSNEITILINDNLKSLIVLPPMQRSVLILRELFGYTAEEVSELIDSSVSAVKSALHRGREKLKQNNIVDDTTRPTTSAEDKARLNTYSAYFNERNFDQLRNLLTAEVRLDLIDKNRRQGRKNVGDYFSNYNGLHDWYMAPGTIEGKPVVLAFDSPDTKQAPLYFILLNFEDNGLSLIRDFRYARYVMDDAEWALI